jgi:hypothetical protein
MKSDTIAYAFCDVLHMVPYDNEIAKASELSRHTLELIRASFARVPDTIHVARSSPASECLSSPDVNWLAWSGQAPDALFNRIGIRRAIRRAT